LGNNRYQYHYTVTNNPTDSGTASIQLLDIIFDKTRYKETSLMPVSSSNITNVWKEAILSSVSGDNPVYDAFSITGILDAQTMTGFKVEFEWIGVGTPSSKILRSIIPIIY